MDYAVIMAGGTGKRLWPLSRESRPKQVLRLLNGETLIRRCFERLRTIFDDRNILVLTNAGFANLVRENLPEIPYGNVLAEPVVRDTAGAVGLAATVLSKFDPNATMAILTADQLIEPAEVFENAIKDGLQFINENPESLLTFGIKPKYASTQFGYIKIEAKATQADTNSIYKVASFREKPDADTAREYLKSEEYCWNSGMFVWKAKRILTLLKENLPQTEEPLKRILVSWDGPNQAEALKEWFPKLPKISIDFAVMEKAPNVHAIRMDCKWLDMGSFAALADIINSDENGNIIMAGYNELIDSENNILITEEDDHLIAVIGLKNMVVAHSPDATLVCSLDETDRLKELLERLREKTGEKFL